MTRGSAILALVALIGCGGTAGPPGPVPRSPATAASPEPLRLVPVAGGLRSPVQVLAGGGGLWAVEQAGRVVELPSRRVVLDIRRAVRSGGEQGLLSVALHPRRPRLYAHYTDLRGDTRVVEYARGTGQPRLRRQLLSVDQPYPNYNGG